MIHYYEDGREELYNLTADPGESKDQASENAALVKEMRAKLFTYLDHVGARFPERDPPYDPDLEGARLKKMEEVRMPRFEQQRRNFLSKDYNPGNDWWGSSILRSAGAKPVGALRAE